MHGHSSAGYRSYSGRSAKAARSVWSTRLLCALGLVVCLAVAGAAFAMTHQGSSGAAPATTHSGSPAGSTASAVDPARLLASMTTKQKVGQLFMVSFNGTSMSPQLRSFIRSRGPGGLAIFGQNYANPGQLKGLISGLQSASHVPLFISVDQEGGEVVRITSGVKVMPSEAYYGNLRNPGRLYNDAVTVGRQLRQLGVNMNFAPVADVLTNPNSPIGSRSFGSDPVLDGRLTRAAVNGYQHGGVAATVKHFIGLGTVSANAENVLPTASISQAEFQNLLTPFRSAIAVPADAIMVTHIVLPGITSPGVPASLSRAAVTGWVRDRLHFTGVIITDSLLMGGITQVSSVGQACVRALQAGNDIDLVTSGGPTNLLVMTRAMDAVMGAVHSHTISNADLNAKVLRILKLKAKLGLLRSLRSP